MYDETELLPAAQSMLLLLIILFFCLPSSDLQPQEEAKLLVNGWEVTRRLTVTGLLLDEEVAHTRPDWRLWAITSAKRRTILAIHHVEWLWSVSRGYPILTCFELAPLPAPESKFLWNERDKCRWELNYDAWLRVWSKWGGGCTFGALFNIAPGKPLDEKTEMWLAETDEYGMMLMAESKKSESSLLQS